MVKLKDGIPMLPDGSADLESWLQSIQAKGYYQDIDLLRNACLLSQIGGANQVTETGESYFQQALNMADLLADLEVDQETLAAAIVYEAVHYADLALDIVEEQLGKPIVKLVQGVEKMNALSNAFLPNPYLKSKLQLDNLRKILLAMVDDVRVVLIKLAERLCALRHYAPDAQELMQKVAVEAMQIYAPLANRLGIGAIKWELEDLAFRHLQPEDYKAIAKGLKAKRLERDAFVNQIVQCLISEIKTLGIEPFAVYGRAKHIHSIYRKMERKKVPLEAIYDATAVRILVNDADECYSVLSLVHALWQPIPQEFDDYLMKPKDNGYQSLHTAVRTLEGRTFEVQIRSFAMHKFAEMGVAAHWKYKEGGRSKPQSHERKITWLRELLAWHQDVAKSQGLPEQLEQEFLEDRVYVFTPEGDIIDLPAGSTPLDFAYQLHSNLGHRCRGAKINGHIVPLTHVLATGERVELLTGKELRPSRDWTNPHLHYLKTSRAKAKVLHWFKMQDFEKNAADGREILDKELRSLGIANQRLESLALDMRFKDALDLYAALGRGDIKLIQIVNRLSVQDLESQPKPLLSKAEPKPSQGGDDLQIEGVGNLLTSMARCCQPVPGDAVLGYITLGRGVSIHRCDCSNIIHASERQQKRFIAVKWGKVASAHYSVDIQILAFDRPDLLKDITAVLAHERAQVFNLQTQVNASDNSNLIRLSLQIDGIESLSRLLSKLGQIPNVLEARRQVH